jgi:acetolactate decarboxylase
MKAYLFSALFMLQGLSGLMAQTDVIYHYSVLDAMRNGIYAGGESIAALGQQGDFGLGTFNNLDGEMIALDGVYYRIAPDGKVEKAGATRKVPFASVTYFKNPVTLLLTGISTTEDLQKALTRILPSANRPYAIKIHATFSEITAGGANPVSDLDTTGIAELMKVRPRYKGQNLTGTLVGFYHPSYMSGVDLSPFHFHFISDDKSFAGHLISGIFQAPAVRVFADGKDGYQLVLPKTAKGYDRRWNTNQTSGSNY